MFQPSGSRVLVKRIMDDSLKSSLIHLVTLSQEESQFATVLAVGPGYKMKDGSYIPLDVKPGQTVVTKPYSGASVDVVIDGVPVEAYLLADEDVLMVVEP